MLNHLSKFVFNCDVKKLKSSAHLKSYARRICQYFKVNRRKASERDSTTFNLSVILQDVNYFVEILNGIKVSKINKWILWALSEHFSELSLSFLFVYFNLFVGEGEHFSLFFFLPFCFMGEGRRSILYAVRFLGRAVGGRLSGFRFWGGKGGRPSISVAAIRAKG